MSVLEQIDSTGKLVNPPLDMSLIFKGAGSIYMASYPTNGVPPWIDFVVSLSRKPQAHEVPCLHYAFDDGPIVPPKEHLEGIVWAVGNAYKSGQSVLIHCDAGLNRSGLVTAMVLMLIANLDAEAAIELIRRMRSQSCLFNGVFKSWLINYSDNEQYE
jgi:protein-tyrosine phosphatase